jgi:cobalt-zinc-cadmium efflux system outer membrane protein
LSIDMSGIAGPWMRGAALSAFALTLGAASPALGQAADPAVATTPAPYLSLRQALTLASRTDPARAGLSARQRAVEAGVRQADVRPNPTVGLTVENLPTLGAGNFMGLTQTTLTYDQRLERGEDRSARTGLARSEGDLVLARARVAALDRLEEVQRAWAEVLSADALVEIARQRLDLAEAFRTEVQRRVEMARDPLFAGARAEAELAQAQIDLDQAEVTARIARISLVKFWDGTGRVAIDPAAFEDVSASRVVAGEAAGADLAVFQAQSAISEAQARVEEARAVPDPTVSVGVRHMWANDVSLVFGGSIPLQRYDRNQGAIDRARAEGVAARADANTFRAQREREIARLQVQLLARANEARRIHDETLPQAERAVVLVREGFARGGFTYNDVMAAHSALLQTRARRVAVLQTFHNDRARLDRLTGAHADLIGLEAQAADQPNPETRR